MTLIIIIARNNIALTRLAVRSALAQSPPCDVLVANNASTDGTAAWVATKPVAQISYMEQKSLAACWNAALRAAWKCGYQSALVLNNDVEIREDTVALLASHCGEFVTCVSVDEKERMGVTGDRKIEDLRQSEREHPDYSAFLIRKSVTDKAGWFNEECWPAYTEDSDFHVRCHRAGVRAVCIDVPFLHHGASTLKSCDPSEAIIIRRGAEANRARFKAKYGCLPGTPAYEALFGAAAFGVDNPTAPNPR